MNSIIQFGSVSVGYQHQCNKLVSGVSFQDLVSLMSAGKHNEDAREVRDDGFGNRNLSSRNDVYL